MTNDDLDSDSAFTYRASIGSIKTDPLSRHSSSLQVESASRDLHGESSGRATALLLSALPRVSALSALCHAAAARSTAHERAALRASALVSGRVGGTPYPGRLGERVRIAGT